MIGEDGFVALPDAAKDVGISVRALQGMIRRKEVRSHGHFLSPRVDLYEVRFAYWQHLRDKPRKPTR